MAKKKTKKKKSQYSKTAGASRTMRYKSRSKIGKKKGR